MKTIRIGNDIVIDWSIVRNGKAEDFRSKSLSLFICHRYGREKVSSFSVDGNVLRFAFLGKNQRHVGDYGLLLIVNDGADGMFSVDLDRAFCLTQHTDCGCGGVVELMSDIGLPANGLSAYELAVINGFKGTEQDYIAANIPQVNISYSDLVDLRNASKLVAGRFYRITDYVTTVFSASGNERSAGHPFDIIVRALSENELSEHADAIQHEGDEYFADAKLSAWKLWYSIDNDLQKYSWADSDNGKGVIYRMIDEWGNDVPYDFKNIQFKRFPAFDETNDGLLIELESTFLAWTEKDAPYGMSTYNNFVWAYTFNHFKFDASERPLTDVPIDATIYMYTSDIDFWGGGYAQTGGVMLNVIKPKTIIIDIDGFTHSLGYELNNIVFFTYNTYDLYNAASTDLRAVRNNFIDIDCFYLSFLGKCLGNHIGKGCYKIAAGYRFECNRLDNYCNESTFGNMFSQNTFGQSCTHNIFANDCMNNTIGVNCALNMFGNSCISNTIGNHCNENIFGDEVHYGIMHISVYRVKVNTYVSYFVILSGVHGSSNKILELPLDVGMVVQYVAMDGRDGPVIWEPAHEHLK